MGNVAGPKMWANVEIAEGRNAYVRYLVSFLFVTEIFHICMAHTCSIFYSFTTHVQIL